MARRIIIDTDPGIDDALAIFVALRSSELDIAGVTTVAGNIGIHTTTRNAGRILTFCGRSDIPVFAGAARPLSDRRLDSADIHGGDGLGGVALPEPEAAAGDDAIGWMAALLEAEPARSIDVLALGPLTNLARLTLDHPSAAARIGRVIAMGGAIHERGNVGPRAEFNIAADPDAADIVFRSGVSLTLIPLDATRKVRATRETLSILRATGRPMATVSAALIEAYFDSTADQSQAVESRPLHDPCVMVQAADPSIFGLERLAISVDMQTGALDVDDQDGAGIDVALTVDGASCLAFIAGRLSS